MKIKFIFSFLLITLITSCSKAKTKSTETSKETSTKEVKEIKPAPVEVPYVYGIDISKYQGNEADIISSKKDTLGFVICKATEGETYVDPKFQENWNRIRKDGFVRGAYHFYRTIDDPLKQANLFANTIKDMDESDLPPVVDFEAGGIDKSQSIEQIQKDLNRFLEIVEKQLGRKVMIYTDIPVANKYLNDAKYANYALWIANYNGKKFPDLPLTWKEKGWTIWQRNADYKLDNFTDDSDVFNGTRTELSSFIKSYR